MTDTLEQVLRSGRVLVMDGAMGTEIQRRKGDLYDIDPTLTTSIHSGYTRAGADVCLTNTFQLNPIVLAAQDRAARQHALWRSAIRAARAADPAPRYLLGAIGPMLGVTTSIAHSLLQECRGLDGAILETWSSLLDLRTFADASEDAQRPLLVAFTYQRSRKNGWRTFTDVPPESCARAAKKAGATALGVNCGRNLDMKSMLGIAKRYHDVVDLPVFVRPNAGTPKKTARGWHYPRSPQAMAEELPALLEEGIAMIGGCCGTRPAHIRAFAMIVDRWNRRSQRTLRTLNED
jgi:5-methyltetrahydrofolate--homocysteine methyltransferase